MGIDGNETTDELARQGSSHPLTGPELVLGISPKIDRGVIKHWTSKIHDRAANRTVSFKKTPI
jgi:hypothetical protein